MADSVSTLETFVPAGMNFDVLLDSTGEFFGTRPERGWVLSAASDSDALSGTEALIGRAVADGWVQAGPAEVIPRGNGLNVTAYQLNRRTPDGEFRLRVKFYPQALKEFYGHGSRPEVWAEVWEFERSVGGG